MKKMMENQMMKILCRVIYIYLNGCIINKYIFYLNKDIVVFFFFFKDYV
jgi:hypothetical protein